MDAAEQPRVVFDSAAECADRDRAEEAFREVLAPARAQGWVVTVRIEAGPAPAVSAEGEVTDERGSRRAHQVLSGTTADCAGLARAMASWASAALQAEVQRTPGEAPPGAAQPGSGNGALPPLPSAPAPAPAPAPPAAPVAPAMPPAAPPPRLVFPSPDLAPSHDHDETAPLELGVGTFMLVGGGAGGYLGVSPFLIADVGHAVFLRPSVALGVSMATNVSSTLAAARLDTCLRLPGRYVVRGGLQLDVCGGADAGVSYVSSGSLAGTPSMGQTLPYVDLGPSIDLRAEVGRLAVTLRAVGGVNIAREGFDDVTGARVDAPLVSWRLEIAFSWVLHDERAEALIAADGGR
jgi:hypothetical protein